MSHDNVRIIHDTLTELPLIDRLSALCCSIIADDPRAMPAVASLIQVAGVMARQLQPAERLAIAWCLLEEVE